MTTRSATRVAPLLFALLASDRYLLANGCNADQSTLQNFLASNHSPLANYMDDLFHHSLTYSVDPRLLVAIAWQETHAGNNTPTSQYNYWDDFYTGQAYNSPFQSPAQAIADAARTLHDKYLSHPESYRTIRDIGYTYTATQQEAWVANVTSLYVGWGGNVNDLAYTCSDQKVVFFDDAEPQRDPSNSNWLVKQGTWGRAPGVGLNTFFSVQYSWGSGYASGANIAMFTKRLDLTGMTSATLTLWHHYDVGYSDGLNVWISTNGGNGFTLLPQSFNGTEPNWTKATWNLNAFIGNAAVVLAFQMYSGGNNGSHQGWFLDNIDVIGGGIQVGGGQPTIDLDEQARRDMIARAAQDWRFGIPIPSVFGENLNWANDLELRWMLFNVTGNRTALMYQARFKSTGDRWTTYFDPDTNQQVNWVQMH
jgi:hypothetical protein